MKNIDNELIKWAKEKIKNKYHDDVSLLIGQKGGCKIPTDELKKLAHNIIDVTHKFFMENRKNSSTSERNYNYNDLASWYYEARYTFRRIEDYYLSRLEQI